MDIVWMYGDIDDNVVGVLMIGVGLILCYLFVGGLGVSVGVGLMCVGLLFGEVGLVVCILLMV